MHFISDTGRTIPDTEVRTAVRKVVCRREKVHNPDPLVRANSCDGDRIVCGKCDNTAWDIVKDLKLL